MNAPENVTRRDFFAAHALAGMLASEETHGTADQVAEKALSYVDALLAALESEG